MCVINSKFFTFSSSEPVYISPIDLEQYVSRFDLQLNTRTHCIYLKFYNQLVD